MALGTTTLAHLVKLTRQDAFVMAVTLDHDVPIVFESVTYDPTLGLNPTAFESTEGLNVDNLDATGALLALGVDESDIQAGLWDLCEALVYRVNWADLTMGAEKLTRGTFGELSQGRNTFTAELRGITQKLQSTLVELVSPSCKADLGDARCGVVFTEGVTKFSTVAVSTIVLAQRQFTCAALGQAADFFTNGKVTWTTGANAGLSMEIKVHAASGNITLVEPMPYAIVAGDQGTFFAGCRKRFTEDCLGKFANELRFRGFKDLPGGDQMYRGN